MAWATYILASGCFAAVAYIGEGPAAALVTAGFFALCATFVLAARKMP